MTRTVLYRFDSQWVNVNDEIGLAPYSSLTLKDHLQDLEEFDGLRVLARSAECVCMSDGQMWAFAEEREAVDCEVAKFIATEIDSWREYSQVQHSAA